MTRHALLGALDGLPLLGALDASPSECTSPSQALHQRCQRCGTEESAGDFCTWCAMAGYDLIEHTHEGLKAAACPLGPYRNPSDPNNRTPGQQAQLVKARAAWDATHNSADAEPYIVRRWHHPANPRVDDAYLERHPDAAMITALAQRATSAA
jgi:hypothetical protein